MEPSEYQKAILEWLKTGKGHGCCNAVAGSGKSSTLLMAAKLLEESNINPDDVRVTVFGAANAKDLAKKFGKKWENSIGTLHSTGFKILQQEIGKFSPSDRIRTQKYKYLAQDLGLIPDRRGSGGSLLREYPAAVDRAEDFLKIADLVRLTLTEPTAEAIAELAKHHYLEGILKPDTVAQAVKRLLCAGEEAATKKTIDFTDQIWLPVRWQLHKQPQFKPYKFVLVDECQDLNTAQLELSLMLAGDSGRLLYVGDPRQAIMGFAGADNNSYYKIVDRTCATELPLSLCYRCPQSHIALVQDIFPEIPIEAHAGAKAGEIHHLDESKIHEQVKVNDMVLCRRTAPLVALCIQLIAKEIAATVKGRNIAETIKRDLEEIAAHHDFTYDKFNEFAEKYRQHKAAKYADLDNEEELIELLNDKIEALLAIYQGQPNAKSISDLGLSIDALFSDESSPVTLSTCHRAKGLEGDRIFLLQPEKMPMTWRNQLEWQFEQEQNLLYVALTRSKSELFIAGNPNWCRIPAPETEPVVDNVTHTDEPTADRDVLLTEAEQSRLAELEEIIHAGFTSAATALKEIVAGKLYRQTHATFEAYCKERWNFGDRYARNLLAASEVLDNLKIGTNGSELPTNERQIRPLTGLEPDEQREIWTEAVATAPNGKVSGAHVEQVVRNKRSSYQKKPSYLPNQSYSYKYAERVVEKVSNLDSVDLAKILSRVRAELDKRGFPYL